jgi:glycosyltransferase involved in cell wall biosynthesis
MKAGPSFSIGGFDPVLSVTVITLNEEKNLRACLESAAFAGEIVVLDGGSTDRTLAIAREFTDKIYQEPWQGFAAQKNRTLKLAQGPWILSLDADERISPALRSEIQNTLNNPSAYSGFWIPRRNYFGGRFVRWCGWYPDYQLRLFLKEKGAFVPREVHESVKVEGKTRRLKNPLEHYTYASRADYLERMERYAALSAAQYYRQGRKTGQLGMRLHAGFTFFKMLVLKGGFLEGTLGLELSSLSAQYTLVKYARLMALWEKDKKAP